MSIMSNLVNQARMPQAAPVVQPAVQPAVQPQAVQNQYQNFRNQGGMMGAPAAQGIKPQAQQTPNAYDQMMQNAQQNYANRPQSHANMGQPGGLTSSAGRFPNPQQPPIYGSGGLDTQAYYGQTGGATRQPAQPTPGGMIGGGDWRAQQQPGQFAGGAGLGGFNTDALNAAFERGSPFQGGGPLAPSGGGSMRPGGGMPGKGQQAPPIPGGFRTNRGDLEQPRGNMADLASLFGGGTR